MINVNKKKCELRAEIMGKNPQISKIKELSGLLRSYTDSADDRIYNNKINDICSEVELFEFFHHDFGRLISELKSILKS